ncbi:hypothetical protein U1Q18_047240 [Sarracenia purpurea var. burkii]
MEDLTTPIADDYTTPIDYDATYESIVDDGGDTTYLYPDGDLTTPTADDYTTPIDYDATYESIVDDDVDTTYLYPDGDLTTPTDYDESTVKPGVDFGGAGGGQKSDISLIAGTIYEGAFVSNRANDAILANKPIYRIIWSLDFHRMYERFLP